MSSSYCVLHEEQFLCSICLDVFTHPVTIPCGHNFCKKCITQNWGFSGKYECPLCKDMFIRRPVLRVNSVLSEIADQFRQSPLKKPDISSEQQCDKSYVLCDVCTETKLKALKFCMVCKTSYCETHLGPHCTIPGLKRHKLIDPTENLHNILLSEEQFLCSICLDVFTDPVTIPCGHNFCKNCITQHWDVNLHCQCPMCKDVFDRRPELRVNTFISEMAAQFRQSAAKKASSCYVQKNANSGGDVLCDVCTGTKLKALKSCLVCLTSYCETHLEPHHRIPGLKRHKVIDPVENLEDRMCKKHDRPLELYCKTDQMCVCLFCTESDHKPHVFTPVVEEYKVKKVKLEKVEDEIQQMIQERRLKIQQIKQSVKLSQEDADRETAESVEIFTVLIQSVQRGLAQLTDTIKEKQKATEKRAEGFVKELEEEISELIKRKIQVDQLTCTEDHLQFLQSFPSLNTAPPTKDWTEVRVHSSYEGTLRRAVAQLEETLSKQMKKLCADTELKRVQRYAVDVTLDPDTASPYLVLSDDEKQVKSVVTENNVPDNPKRFSMCNGVLGKQGFSSGRFYFEVQVKDKTEWDLGVASELANRKGKIKLSPKNGFWTVWLRHETEYKALAGPGVFISLKSKPQKVGVFVDYEAGLVSFHDVDTATLIYSFTGCDFTEKLFPYLSPCGIAGGRNVAPLILLPLPLP